MNCRVATGEKNEAKKQKQQNGIIKHAQLKQKKPKIKNKKRKNRTTTKKPQMGQVF